MKTYSDLINYADTLPKREIESYKSECIETIFRLPCATLDSVKAFPWLSESVIVSTCTDNRDYFYAVFYFDNIAFAIYTMGGRSERDYENVHVVNKAIWKASKEYVLSLVTVEDECNDEIDIDSYILPEYGCQYPWEFLPEKHQPDFFVAKAEVRFLEGSNLAGQKPIELTGHGGYTSELAVVNLQKKLDRFKENWRDNNVEYGTIRVEKVI
jgi:hypothetical protein